jgi:DNA-binding transcriptional LysR family regulator
MTIDLDALRVFVKVAELASFTRAAEHLGMSKARASLRVRALEADLGAHLLQRTTRTVALTRDGERLLPRARQLVGEAEDVGAMFQAGRALRGVVRIDLPINLAREAVIPRVPELLAAHPELELQVSTTDRRVEVVREGFDCVLSVGTLAPSGLIARRLGELAMVNCASPSYLRRRGTPRTLDDLAGHVLVGYAPRFGGDAPAFEYRAGDHYALLPMRSAIAVNSTDAYRAACLAGLGIIQVPVIGVRDQLETGDLVEILPDLPSEPMPVSLVHAHGRRVPRRVRAVMTWLAEVIAPRLEVAVTGPGRRS